MSHLLCRAATLATTVLLALALPGALASATPEPAVVAGTHITRAPGAEPAPTSQPVEIIDALVIERGAPTDVVPQLPDEDVRPDLLAGVVETGGFSGPGNNVSP